MKRLAALVLIVFGLAAMPAVAQPTAPADPALHNQLRAIKDRLVTAVNKKDEAALLAELDPNIAFTAMNNETFHGIPGARAYYARMMVGSSRVVDAMSISATPDGYSVLYAGDTAAISTGTSTAHFKIRGGAEFDVPLRWTATLVKTGPTWKLAAVHFSANMFDNPIMNGVKSFAWWIAIGALLIGLGIGWLLGRRRRRPA